ncbi:dihydroorotate dehydrogenase [Bacillus sp. REN16]|uniref:dihydroorotate dehydrogenase n=1 Tax=Bacillus sp. REN16 TaxID=2887296 RepID=UPI001E30121E|nr:dihydroorotate dehydrogenase [Bacillus sp. REN16]MCC3358223.1 dihydroorotate dehydrogenase [Bacillus sp. REN16]
MPDWSYHVLFQPILSRLSSYQSREFIHRGMNLISSLPGGHRLIHFLGREESSKLVKKEIHGISYPNPVGLSGKIDPLLTGSNAFSNLGFGFIEMGPVTKEPAMDPTLPIVNWQKQQMEFSANYESIGLVKTIQKLKKWKPKQPVWARLAGTSEEQQEIITELEPYVAAFVTTSSSSSWATDHPVYLSVPVGKVKALSLDHIQSTFSGIVIDNPMDMSNDCYLRELLDSIHHLRENGFTLPIISVGGIHEPAHALALFDAGADLVLLSEGYVFSGPGLTKRITEALLYKLQPEPPLHPAWIWYWLFGLAIFIGGAIAVLFSLTTIILPYDEQFLGMQRDKILLFNERVLYFMAHDRMTLAGTMISGGIVYMALARFGVRKQLLWAKQAIDFAAILGFLGIFLFIGYGYFDWLHLVFWLILLPIYLTGFIKTRQLNGTPTSLNTRNHRVWKQSLIGQLAFIILGFSFVLGGIVISFIGITNVFVSTDILYLCMPPEMIDSFNNKLISVIAHDRAGFGSALLSVGLLVLTISLWGFQQGNRWVWWTLLVGGLPAFFAGIWIHFAIGYTTFIHLLPAYFALCLFFVGLIMTYRFFHMGKDKI